MNQILSTEDINNKFNNNNNKSKGKKGPKDIRTVTKFFAVILFVFGVFLIANSSLALFGGETKKEEVATKPSLQLEDKDNGEQFILKIMHDKAIKEVEYYWNDEEPTVVNGDQRKYIEKTIDIPTGENTFTVKATDVNGEKVEYSKTYTLEGKLKIDIKQSGNNIKITVTGQDEIKKVEYAWDDDDLKELEITEGQTEQTFEIQVQLGEHEFMVKATDINDESSEENIKITGTTKPTIKLSKGDDAYVIKAHDDIALDRIEITTISDGKTRKIESDGKDFTYEFPLKEGDENRIQIVAYNSNGVASDPVKAKWKK
ncbi:MAG: hypothetical protein J6I85_02400 [Clostridia bacterium]|nr:hypothetical protein [Clostridia bacterium]